MRMMEGTLELVFCGRLVYTCNGARAFKGNNLGKGTKIGENNKELEVGKGV